MTRLPGDDRAVSTAVTHVLAIGITTILITGLLVGGSGLLDDQEQQAAQNELKTIGNRIATQISMADNIVNDSGGPENVTFYIDQPGQVAGDSYSAQIKSASRCAKGNAVQPDPTEGTNRCILLRHDSVNGGRVEVPFEVDGDANINFQQTGTGEFILRVCSPSLSCPIS